VARFWSAFWPPIVDDFHSSPDDQSRDATIFPSAFILDGRDHCSFSAEQCRQGLHHRCKLWRTARVLHDSITMTISLTCPVSAKMPNDKAVKPRGNISRVVGLFDVSENVFPRSHGCRTTFLRIRCICAIYRHLLRHYWERLSCNLPACSTC
jgi:hypothetical protein